MFVLHDRVRRRICVAGFILLCVLPTLAVLGWAAVWSLPWHVRSEARWSGRQLGMEVLLGRVEHLRPGAVRLGHVVLRDCEDRQIVLRCEADEAELKAAKSRSGTPRRVLLLRAATTEIDADRLPGLGKLTRRLVELRAGNLDIDVWFAVETVALRSPRSNSGGRLSAVRGAVETVESGTQAWLEFRDAGQKMARPALVRLGRNRQLQPPADWVELDTGGAALPCALLSRGIPAMGCLGTNARFRGYIAAQSTSAGWDGVIRPASQGEPACELLDVDLDRLVTDWLPHTLGGKARIAIAWASFRAGRVEKAYGGVSGGPGEVSLSLLAAAAEHLGLAQLPSAAAASDPMPYDGLAFQFELDERRLLIKQWWSDRKGVMIAGGKTLLATTGRMCPVVALARATAPGSSLQAPATGQSERLLRHLALPESVPAAAVHGNSRLATEGEPSPGHNAQTPDDRAPASPMINGDSGRLDGR